MEESVVRSFSEITSCSREEALFFLESHKWDLDTAVSTFFDNNANANANANLIAPPNPIAHSPSPTPPPATSSIRTFSDLNTPHNDHPQEYYTGGQKSGMLVQDPTRGNDVNAIFDQARQAGAVEATAEHLRPPASSTSFTGTARLLSGETVSSTPQPRQPEVLTHTITFWLNGFTIDDGPLRRMDDPANAPFLESIRKSECPAELEPADRSTSVHVNLMRREENYSEPVRRPGSFQGMGRTLGSSDTAQAASASAYTAPTSITTASPPSVGLVVDGALPSTSIQLRLADGTRMVSRFNYHHTIRDIHAFINASRPGGTRSYQLQMMGFPPKQLTDLDQTIEQAGLASSVVIQKL